MQHIDDLGEVHSLKYASKDRHQLWLVVAAQSPIPVTFPVKRAVD